MPQASAAANRGTVASPIVAVFGLTKTYDNGLTALRDIKLDIHKGEIFALLGFPSTTRLTSPMHSAGL